MNYHIPEFIDYSPTFPNQSFPSHVVDKQNQIISEIMNDVNSHTSLEYIPGHKFELEVTRGSNPKMGVDIDNDKKNEYYVDLKWGDMTLGEDRVASGLLDDGNQYSINLSYRLFGHICGEIKYCDGEADRIFKFDRSSSSFTDESTYESLLRSNLDIDPPLYSQVGSFIGCGDQLHDFRLFSKKLFFPNYWL